MIRLAETFGIPVNGLKHEYRVPRKVVSIAVTISSYELVPKIPSTSGISLPPLNHNSQYPTSASGKIHNNNNNSSQPNPNKNIDPSNKSNSKSNTPQNAPNMPTPQSLGGQQTNTSESDTHSDDSGNDEEHMIQNRPRRHHCCQCCDCLECYGCCDCCEENCQGCCDCLETFFCCNCCDSECRSCCCGFFECCADICRCFDQIGRCIKIFG